MSHRDKGPWCPSCHRYANGFNPHLHFHCPGGAPKDGLLPFRPGKTARKRRNGR